MTICESLLSEFDAECANTRKHLERVPVEKMAWKPHEKSFSMAALAAHLATIPTWGKSSIETDTLDIAPDGEMPKQPQAGSTGELLELFDKAAAEMRAALAATNDEHLSKNWTLLVTGKEIFTMPRIAVLRSMILNHSIHHRAQLGVYLRLCDVAVPAVYGPSADEGGMM